MAARYDSKMKIFIINCLVNGVGTVDVAKLAAMTSFNDESSLTTNDSTVKRFETWFWEVVNSFTQSERQELLYFWTGKVTFTLFRYIFENEHLSENSLDNWVHQ